MTLTFWHIFEIKSKMIFFFRHIFSYVFEEENVYAAVAYNEIIIFYVISHD